MGDNMNTVEDIGYNELDINERKFYRPHIVFFGENVPMINVVTPIVEEADILVIIGTSLQVYPAAGLIDLVIDKSIYVINPESPSDDAIGDQHITHIQETATSGMKKLLTILNS